MNGDMETIVFEDGFSTQDVVARLTSLCVTHHDIPILVRWDLSKLTYVPWAYLVPIATALGKLREQLSATISSSLVILPNNQWRLALSAFFLVYKPATDVQVVVAKADDVEKQLTERQTLSR